MRVPAEVFDGIAETVKCFFYVRTPVLCIKAAAEFRPVEGIAQFSAGGGKAEAPILIEFLEPCEEFSFKLIPQHFDRDEKVTPCRAYVTAGGKAAAGNNTMHMHVVAKLLVPGMQDLDDTGCCAEVFLIRREFQERISAAFMEKPIKELLVSESRKVRRRLKRKLRRSPKVFSRKQMERISEILRPLENPGNRRWRHAHKMRCHGQ